MLLRKSVFCFIVGLLLASVSASVSAYGGSIPDIRQNGWVHPVGDYRSYESCAQFGGPSTGGYDGHVGSDLCRPSGMSVVAIADGCVQDFSSSLGGYGSWSGDRGGAVLLRHKTESGRIFYAVYGHNTPNTSYLNERKCTNGGAKSVAKGDKIATLHPYVDKNGKRADHLHFGIRPDTVDPVSLFRGNGCTATNNCGWVNPFEFLNANRPAPSIYACAPVSGSERVCWRTKNWHDLSCERGYSWFVNNSIMWC